MTSVKTAKPHAVPMIAPSNKRVPKLYLLDLPIELIELLLGRLDSCSLSKLACVCKQLNHQSCQATRWKALFEERWGIPSKTQSQAAEIAGGWKNLYISKDPLGDIAPSPWEVRAVLESLTACASPKGVACCALIDGSGSMSPGDFDIMTGVVIQLSEALKECPNSQLSVIQFSGRTQVEIPLQPPGWLDYPAAMKAVAYGVYYLSRASFKTSVSWQTRMSGGTNLAAAALRAAAEMSSLDEEVQRIVVIMSDFRIDDYSAAEAVAAANTVSQEQPKTCYFAFGVGRMVELKLVTDLLSAGTPLHNLDAYLWLGFQDEPVDLDY